MLPSYQTLVEAVVHLIKNRHTQLDSHMWIVGVSIQIGEKLEAMIDTTMGFISVQLNLKLFVLYGQQLIMIAISIILMQRLEYHYIPFSKEIRTVGPLKSYVK
jgi:hypothetical protein